MRIRIVAVLVALDEVLIREPMARLIRLTVKAATQTDRGGR
jgi:hypothetical protein